MDGPFKRQDGGYQNVPTGLDSGDRRGEEIARGVAAVKDVQQGRDTELGAIGGD